MSDSVTYSVRDTGAIGNGTTIDTPAIASTLSRIPITGGILYFPPGTYAINNPIVLPSYVEMRGSHEGNVTILASALVDPLTGHPTDIMLTNEGAASTSRENVDKSITIKHMSFDGNVSGDLEAAEKSDRGASLHFAKCYGVTIEDCVIYGFVGQAIRIDGAPGGAPLPGNHRIWSNTLDAGKIIRTHSAIATDRICVQVKGYQNVQVCDNVIGYNPVGAGTVENAKNGIDLTTCSDITVTRNQIACS